MRNYSYTEKWKSLLTPEVVALLTQIYEHKGRQALFVESKADVLSSLADIAKIQSTEASNKIEGIYTSDSRLKLIVNEKATPKNRNEEEIAGYRDVLATIHENYDYIPVKSNYILQLHRDLYKFSGFAGGNYKASNNVISEKDSQGNEFVRFIPVEAWETQEAIEILCESYRKALDEDKIDPLLVIPMFILDFLCIHPFSDGNGRMSRLLTLLLLYRADYIVGKYISIEKIIEQSKETYYETLQASSQAWHEGKNDYKPFVSYILGAILSAYRELENRVNLLSTSNLSKAERIEELIKQTLGKITKAEIIEKCPDISAITVERTLKDLLDKGKIEKVGKARATAYFWRG